MEIVFSGLFGAVLGGGVSAAVTYAFQAHQQRKYRSILFIEDWYSDEGMNIGVLFKEMAEYMLRYENQIGELNSMDTFEIMRQSLTHHKRPPTDINLFVKGISRMERLHILHSESMINISTIKKHLLNEIFFYTELVLPNFEGDKIADIKLYNNLYDLRAELGIDNSKLERKGISTKSWTG